MISTTTANMTASEWTQYAMSTMDRLTQNIHEALAYVAATNDILSSFPR